MRFRTQSQLQQRSRARRGAALVEFALVGWMALFAMFAAFEYARYMFTRSVFENAARAGARYAATHTREIIIEGSSYPWTEADVISQVVQPRMMGMGLQNQDINIYTYNIVTGQPNTAEDHTQAEFGEPILCRIEGDYQFLAGKIIRDTPIHLVIDAVILSEAN